MKKLLYTLMGMIAWAHDRILALNDGFPAALSDKQLHFLVIGVLGMLLFFLIHPIFKALIRRGHETVISWFYVFTLVIVITFAIEIGQGVTHTGTLEFADIVFGVVGFLSLFAVYALIRLAARQVLRRVRKGREERL